MGIFGRLRNHPRWLEIAYKFTEKVFIRLDPLIRKIGYSRADRWLRGLEKVAKQAVFNCKMCGQCTLHFTGMTCPMTCPKNLRNGPCGGVRSDKSCEVDPGMKCVWVEAYERSTQMEIYGNGFFNIQPPLNQHLNGRSAFINLLSGEGDWISSPWQSPMGNSHERK